jgi:hypothetical protein
MYHTSYTAYTGTGVINTVLECLTVAGLLRLLVGIWVFSNPDVFDYQSIYQAFSSSYSTEAEANSSGYLPAWIESRLIRTNVFPLLLFVLVILFVRLLLFIQSLNPMRIMYSYLKCFYYMCRRNKVYAIDAVEKVRPYDLFLKGDFYLARTYH